MSHAMELATAMECRCYTGDDRKRTHLVKFQLRPADFSALGIVLVLIAAAVLLNGVKIFGV